MAGTRGRSRSWERCLPRQGRTGAESAQAGPDPGNGAYLGKAVQAQGLRSRSRSWERRFLLPADAGGSARLAMWRASGGGPSVRACGRDAPAGFRRGSIPVAPGLLRAGRPPVQGSGITKPGAGRPTILRHCSEGSTGKRLLPRDTGSTPHLTEEMFRRLHGQEATSTGHGQHAALDGGDVPKAPRARGYFHVSSRSHW